MSGRILVVDTIATNRMVLRAKLASSYYDVVQADTGAEALEKIRSDLPDIVLLDPMTPDIDGFSLCRTIKEDPEISHTPVIMISTLVGPKQVLRALEAGAEDLLSKPLNNLALFSRIRNLARTKFVIDELRLRNATSEELGLDNGAESSVFEPDTQVRAVLVPPTREVGEAWQAGLSQILPYRFEVETAAQVAARNPTSQVADIYVIHSKPGQGQDGLKLVSQMRAHPKTRNAVVIVAVPPGAQAVAAKSLDLGASDCVFDPVNMVELSARLKAQLGRKRMIDGLRSSFAESLRLALVDPLTGLYNRRYATRHLGRIANRAGESGKPFALMVLDIDNFKVVNDRYGHATGDRVLKEFSRRIQENLRGIDLVSRLGGEEFLVAMPDTTRQEALVAAERLRQVIGQSRFAADQQDAGLRVTVSIGVTIGDPFGTEVDQLLMQADKALYSSKSDGRNLVTLFRAAA